MVEQTEKSMGKRQQITDRDLRLGSDLYEQEGIGMGKEKRPNLNRARNMDIDAWRQRQISKRLKQRIEEDNRVFAIQHAKDTDDALRDMIRKEAFRLGRMPHPLELQGGHFLTVRLGDWQKLSMSLGYAPPHTNQGQKAYRRLWQEEEERFAEERRKHKKAKRKRAKQIQENYAASKEWQRRNPH